MRLPARNKLYKQMTAVKTKPHPSNIGNNANDPLESSSPSGKLLLQTFTLFNRSHRPANRVALLEESANQPHRYIAIGAGDEDLFFPSVWFYHWHVKYREFGRNGRTSRGIQFMVNRDPQKQQHQQRFPDSQHRLSLPWDAPLSRASNSIQSVLDRGGL
jgi:hypothetical protein